MEGGVSGTLNIIELMCGSEKVSFQRELEVLFRGCFGNLLYSNDSGKGQLYFVRSRIIPSDKF